MTEEKLARFESLLEEAASAWKADAYEHAGVAGTSAVDAEADEMVKLGKELVAEARAAERSFPDPAVAE